MELLKIKASSSGFILKYDPDADFNELLEETKKKFSASRDFFRDAKKAVAFEGHEFSDEEKERIVSCIEENSDLKIPCIIDEDLEEAFKAVLSKNKDHDGNDNASSEKDNELSDNDNKAEKDTEQTADTGDEKKPEQTSDTDNEKKADRNMETDVPKASFSNENLPDDPLYKPAFIYRGSLRSGQQITSDVSVIVLGDINAGAEVTAGENVIVLGDIKGTVSAGNNGNTKSFIIAQKMNPIQIRISGIIAASPDSPEKKKKHLVKKKQTEQSAKIAYLVEENIFIDDLTRDLYRDIIWKTD